MIQLYMNERFPESSTQLVSVGRRFINRNKSSRVRATKNPLFFSLADYSRAPALSKQDSVYVSLCIFEAK